MGILDVPSRATKIGSIQIDVTSHATTLSSVEASYDRISFVGSLSADMVFQLPSVFSSRKIENGTTGNFFLFIKRGSAGLPVCIQSGETIEVI